MSIFCAHSFITSPFCSADSWLFSMRLRFSICLEILREIMRLFPWSVSYFRFLVPLMVYQLAPLAALVATLVTLGMLAKNNEVTAFKASGVSLYRLCLPLVLAGMLLAGGMFVLDDTYLPYANQRQDALRNQIKGRPAQTYFHPAHEWIFGENTKVFNYEIFDADHDLFGGLSVFELDPATFQLRRQDFRQPGALGADTECVGAGGRLDARFRWRSREKLRSLQSYDHA